MALASKLSLEFEYGKVQSVQSFPEVSEVQYTESIHLW